MHNKHMHNNPSPTVQQDKLVAQLMHIERRSILPPPSELAEYEKIRPGITDIILTSFQEQSQHRMELEKQVITSGMQNARRGQLFAFILALITIAGGFVLIFLNKDVLGIASIISSLSVLLGVFIYGNKSKKNERIQKDIQNP